MPCRRIKALTIVLVLVLTRTTAAADRQHVQTEAPRLMCLPPAPASACIELVPGRFVDEETWSQLDEALRGAEDEATRLRAENASLRESAGAWQPGWATVLTVLAAGLAGGWYVRSQF